MTVARGAFEAAEGERLIRERSVESLELLGNQLAGERFKALEAGQNVPIGFVISAGIEGYPADSGDEGKGVMVMATAFISHSDPERFLDQLFSMIRHQVKNA